MMQLIYDDRGNGKAPTKAHDGDAGWDLYSPIDFMMMPGEVRTVDLMMALALEGAPAHYLRLAPKSGLANKYGVVVLGGVVDAGYTDNVRVVLGRIDLIRDGLPNGEPWRVSAGDKICQVVPELIVDVQEAVPGRLDPPAEGQCGRGDRGFGSSGDR